MTESNKICIYTELGIYNNHKSRSILKFTQSACSRFQMFFCVFATCLVMSPLQVSRGWKATGNSSSCPGDVTGIMYGYYWLARGIIPSRTFQVSEIFCPDTMDIFTGDMMEVIICNDIICIYILGYFLGIWYIGTSVELKWDLQWWDIHSHNLPILLWFLLGNFHCFFSFGVGLSQCYFHWDRITAGEGVKIVPSWKLWKKSFNIPSRKLA